MCLQRQLDIGTLIQFYCDALNDLLASEHFQMPTNAFEICEENNDSTIDVNALQSTVDTVKTFALKSSNTDLYVESALLDVLLKIPQAIKVSYTTLIMQFKHFVNGKLTKRIDYRITNGPISFFSLV